MTKIRYYGTGSIPGFEANELPGRLIVLEGTDGVGRSTQVALLHEWLEANGYAVAQTGLARSSLVGPGLTRAKQGHTLGDITLNLFYATDFADRLEKEILPALRAGFVCLTDRYIYSVIARAMVRGVDYGWLRELFGFALVPDAVFYLEADLDHLIHACWWARGSTIGSRGWTCCAGMTSSRTTASTRPSSWRSSGRSARNTSSSRWTPTIRCRRSSATCAGGSSRS